MIEKKVLEFFVEKRKADGLQFDTDLFKGGFIDSLFAFEMVVYLESAFGIKIPDTEINADNFRTINDITAMIQRIKGE